MHSGCQTLIRQIFTYFFSHFMCCVFNNSFRIIVYSDKQKFLILMRSSLSFFYLVKKIYPHIFSPKIVQFSSYTQINDPFWVIFCICCEENEVIVFYVNTHLSQRFVEKTLFTFEWSWYSSWKLVDRRYTALFLKSQFHFIDLYSYPYASATLS